MPVTAARPRKVTASMVNSLVRLAGSEVSTIRPPTSAPMPMPRLTRVNWSAKARDRSALRVQRTIIVASAGWQVVKPAPNRKEETSSVGALPAWPKANAPTAAIAVPASSTGRGPYLSMPRPMNGSTASAASANTVNTAPAAAEPRPRTSFTYTNMYGSVKPLPNALSALPIWTRRSRPPHSFT